MLRKHIVLRVFSVKGSREMEMKCNMEPMKKVVSFLL